MLTDNSRASGPSYALVACYSLAEIVVRVYRCSVPRERSGSGSGGSGRYVPILEERSPDAHDRRHGTEQAAARHFLGASLGDAKRVEL